MPDPWATFGLDLHLERGGPGIRVGLERGLREAIRDGRLPAGSRLPSSRSLAGDLGIARNTVTEAYSQLVAEGWLSARRGSATRVSATATRATPGYPLGATQPTPTARAPARFSLRPGAPDLAAFPRSAWLAASRRALAAASAQTLDYSDPQGLLELRTAVADYAARARGARASPERVLICGGFTQGWSLLCGVLYRRGVRSLAMERYGVGLHRRIAERNLLDLVSMDVDERGAVIEPGGATAMLLTAAHQFPIGVALDSERRNRAIAWAAKHDGLIVEDDYDGEFRYDRQPVGALQALDGERVIYAGTVSKSLVPGLRLGWLILPQELVLPMAEAQALTLGNVPAIEQLTLAQFISSGAYDRHVRRARLIYKRRLDQLATCIASAAPQLRLTGIAAGLHAMLRLPDGVRSADLIKIAAEHGLALDDLAHFCDGEAAQALVIGYGTPPDHAYTASLARLAAVLRRTV